MRRAGIVLPSWYLVPFVLLITSCGSLLGELQRIEKKTQDAAGSSGGTGSNGGTATPTVSYSIAKTWFFQNAAITPLVPTVAGSPTACTASPTLPAGLSIDATTCTISGTPTATQGFVSYIITAASSYGSGSTQLTLRVANATATRVYGQFGSFACSVVNNNGSCAAGAASADSVNNPEDVAVDSTGVYLNDRNNSRVLHFSGSSTTPDRVYGQFGNFACAVQNNNGSCASGGISANNLNIPEGIAADSSGIYIADSTNNRVMHYSGTSTTPDRVYGQFGAYTCSQANNNGACAAGAPSANSLNNPLGVFVETGGVYIIDSGNHRVLHYTGTSIIADRVYGQFGNLACGISNNNGSCGAGSTSANGLNNPVRGAADSNGVYIADYLNNRVLHYSGVSTTADRVYGHFGSFTCSVANNNGACGIATTSAGNLNNPYGVALETNGVYIVDRVNNRIVHYTGTSTTADRVYGQAGSLSVGGVNNGGLSASSIFNASGIAVDSTGLYIVDYGNQRVLFY